MKKESPTTPAATIPNARVAILQALWHAEHTTKMVASCREILEKAQCAEVVLHQLPGSYELPLAAKKLAKLKRFDAIVVFGAIVKGDTDHYQVILDTCIRELGKVMYEFEVPIIMEILPVLQIKDLIDRCEGPHNKGVEAGLAAVETIAWHRRVEGR